MPTRPGVCGAATDHRAATCKTTPARPPPPGRTPRAGCRLRPSERRSERPGSPPHRLLDPEGSGALEHITLHRQLRVLLTQPAELVALALAQRAIALTGAPVQVHPPAQRALVQPELPSHPRDRPAGLPDNPNRTLPELSIKISPFHRRHFLIAMSPQYEGKPTCSIWCPG